MKLSDFIIEYRKERGLSQRQFAEACGLSNGYISMIENNVNPKSGQPPVLTYLSLKKIATSVGMSLQELSVTVDDIVIAAEDDLPANKTPTIEESGRLNEFINLFGQLPEDHQTRIIREIKGILSGQ